MDSRISTFCGSRPTPHRSPSGSWVSDTHARNGGFASFATRRMGALRSLAVLLTLLSCRPGAGESGLGGGEVAGNPAGAADQAAEADTWAGRQIPPRNTAWVIIGDDTVKAEIAATTEERQRGLMFRDSVPDGSGMLFVFEGEPAIRSFWMENTVVPLDIAFIDVNQRIVEILAMEPNTTDLYTSSSPSLFALEVPQGWFQEHGIRAGDAVALVFGPR